ncbi:MAG: hypothetical protein ABIY51_11085 [Ferruginibacter sp.]
MAYVKDKWMLGKNPDINIYEDVHSAAGWYRRKKRSKGTAVNHVLKHNAKNKKPALAAADRILAKLNEWTRGLQLHNVRMTMSGRLIKRLNETEDVDYKYMPDIEIQPYKPLSALLKSPYRVDLEKEQVVITIDLTGRNIELKNSIATDYFFDAIILWGDPMKEKSLRVNDVESKLYAIKSKEDETCVLSLDLPVKKEPWLVLLKVSCLEGNEYAINARHYGMKVVGVSVGE